jgi:FKBP-type peptidyl-prolyl cis-trans isomerase FkpA
MRKLGILSILLATLVFTSCQKQKAGGADVKLTTEEDKTFYSVGTMFGQRLKNLNLSDKELDLLAAGLRDSAKGSKLQVESSKYQKKVQEIFKSRIKASSIKTKEDGKKFLETFVSAGAKKTPSGLAYKVLTAGKGKAPKQTDIVEVHYKGTLIDGTVFDSSYERKNKVTFPLNRVIKGWTEGLQLIKEGGKIELVIPSELAYGDQGAPPKIPGGSTLKFEVELFTVKAAPAPKAAAKSKKK